MPTPCKVSASGKSAQRQNRELPSTSKPSSTFRFASRPSARNSTFFAIVLRAALRQLHQRKKRLIDRRGNAELRPAPRNVAIQGIDLCALAAIQILSSRRERLGH